MSPPVFKAYVSILSVLEGRSLLDRCDNPQGSRGFLSVQKDVRFHRAAGMVPRRCRTWLALFMTVCCEIAEPRREPAGRRLVVAVDRRLQQNRS